MSTRSNTSGSKPDLRTRKALKTRQTVIASARGLFAERGYDATSLEDIADVADVSVSTIRRYFESKERLALARKIEWLEIWRNDVEAPEGPSTMQRWRDFVRRSATSDRAYGDWLADTELLASSGALVRLESQILRDYEDLLARAFSRESGVEDGEDLQSRLLAALLVAGNQTVFRRWLADGGTRDLAQTCLDVVDFAEERLGIDQPLRSVPLT